MNDIEEIKSRINIVDVIGEKVRLKKAGVNYFGVCPFHNEKTPSFSVNENLQIFKCFGCGESGDAISFLTKINHYSFRDALEELAERVGYKLSNSFHGKDDEFEKKKIEVLEINKVALKFFQEQLLNDNSNDGYKYSKKRNITEEIITKYGIGYAPHSSQSLTKYLERIGYKSDQILKSGVVVKKDNKNLIEDKFKDRLIFTVFDIKGNPVGFSGRYIGPEKKDFSPPKYLNSPETILFNKSKLLFGLYQAQNHIRKLKFIILTEGQMNVVSSSRVGVGNIVASLGTSFTFQHLELLRRYSNTIYLAFDKDTAGKNATFRTLEMIFGSNLDIVVKILDWDSSLGKDPDEVIAKSEKYWINSVNNPLDPIDYFLQEFNSKYPKPTFENINSFINKIVPLVQRIGNLVRRDEYLKTIARYFDINLSSLLNTFKDIKTEVKIEDKNQDLVSSKHQDLYEQVFALILQNWQELKGLLLGIQREFVLDEYLELYDCMITFSDAENVKDLYAQLEPEIAKKIENLALKPLNLDTTLSFEEHIIKNLPNMLRIKYQELSSKIEEDPENIHFINQRTQLAHFIVEFSNNKKKPI